MLLLAAENFWGNAIWFVLLFGVIFIFTGAADGDSGCMGFGFILFALGVLGFIIWEAAT